MIKVTSHTNVEQLIGSDPVVCRALYHTQAVLSCDMNPPKQNQSDTVSCSTHSCSFPILYLLSTLKPIYLTTQ